MCFFCFLNIIATAVVALFATFGGFLLLQSKMIYKKLKQWHLNKKLYIGLFLITIFLIFFIIFRTYLPKFH